MTFCWLITSLPMYQKSIDLRIDHTRVQKIERQCCSTTHEVTIAIYCLSVLDYEQTMDEYFTNVKNLGNQIFPMNTVDQNLKKINKITLLHVQLSLIDQGIKFH